MQVAGIHQNPGENENRRNLGEFSGLETDRAEHKPTLGSSGNFAEKEERDKKLAKEREEAKQVLRAAVARDRENPFAWYQLGVVYAARGDTARARLASAEQQVMNRQYGLALRSAQAAEYGLEHGTPDWIRAQDIGMQARALLERQCEMERGRDCAPG